MSAPLPLAAASERLRGKPGRPRKVLAPEPPPVIRQIRRLLDVDAAAAYLSCSVWTIRDLAHAGILKRVLIPTAKGGELRKLLLDLRDLDELIARWKDAGPA